MIKTFKYRLFPGKKQLYNLEQALEACRWLYNNTLAYRKNAYEQEGKSVTHYETMNRLPQLKAEKPELAKVHSQVLQQVCTRVDLAFQAFFRRCKTGENPGYPRFKGKGRYDSLTFPQSGFKLDGNKLILSKLGTVKIVLHRPLEGKIKTLTLTRSSTGKWYICFSVEIEPKRLPVSDEVVGIDVGLKTFATLSDGQEIENPRFFRQEEKALAKASRKLAKEVKGTPKRKKRRKVVARVHERIRFKRNNFTHGASRKIVNQFGTIFVEDLHVNRMLHNHCLAKSISDAAWSNFFGMLHAKAEEAGRVFLKVNPAYTSQTCSKCGRRASIKLTLDVRIFNCEYCNHKLDRDLNAALNIKAVGLHSMGLPLDAPGFSRGE